ncbi:MAG: bifunctional hydroxymethylpyrimidine kinase/phosphomethylpyrimidine kinase [Nitrospinaceae bacterium]|jgi:hydroxymethylpyrimidine/phosphomethylpyrimidine kinase|nr:bifunctional hydroxymethylpyrimidine kinase/phosphomethylpyrimidine kinase [Nitrospinaceae bacterium]MBT3434844.1 bifunctional hydroxymethylpyrimidine kinase/phosphomethylpyrimidine kinase [Nitrospinaceae bacterium]MBT3823208.1 bifunctional hydroxymethylpyrimidine kinase/phosphomethylpyrimidine kinase [Nitrospinaceae bacterium]MBT4092900.1 bifunctional hydroxymethylpyrimidine kinase/phosphomethylpyrimidine kinase [Nitrospinaceae bacterium]MBT4429875.1 bifunctional hydroxymethylpyrimidine kin
MNHQPKVPVALSIAGSDSGGGAGIQADLKTFSAFGVFGTTVITALTSQNTRGVHSTHPVPPDFIASQFDSVCTDFPVAATKVGMLATSEVIEVVAKKVAEHNLTHLVLDPVMVSKSGARLLAAGAVGAMVDLLFPLAEIITPNTEEASDILGIDPITNLDEMKNAAHLLFKLGAKSVLLKGGHITKGAIDVFFEGGEPIIFEGRHIDTPNTHGTGCTLSSAIAAGLAGGETIREAVKGAKEFIQGAIENALPLGSGHGPLNHMYRNYPEKLS